MAVTKLDYKTISRRKRPSKNVSPYIDRDLWQNDCRTFDLTPVTQDFAPKLDLEMALSDEKGVSIIAFSVAHAASFFPGRTVWQC